VSFLELFHNRPALPKGGPLKLVKQAFVQTGYIGKQVLWAGCTSCRQTNSVNALKERTYTSCPEKVPLNFCFELCQILTAFQNSFSGKLCSKFLAEQQLNISLRLKRVATLPCEMFVLQNRRAPELSEANCMHDSAVQNSC